ncbi:transposase [Deinococcus peraridilitoris]|uniref:transposase n=1 Tax=Deinococcus peraridilitoris TaxID=432329 RepID=UPI0012FB231F|nr:transposase [Deinococcus peraridilitoris]
MSGFRCCTSRDLVLSFRALLHEKRVQDVEGWLERAKASGVHDLNLFAVGIEREKSALNAAVQLPLSNGPVEGVVNKVKLIKRLMYQGCGDTSLAARRAPGRPGACGHVRPSVVLLLALSHPLG